MRKHYKLCMCACVLLVMSACDNLLDEKTDIKMVVPKGMDDAELLVNDFTTMNVGFPVAGEVSGESYYVPDAVFEGSLNKEQQDFYTWADEIYFTTTGWQKAYKAVFNANMTLELLEGLPTEKEQDKWNKLAGASYFYRAFAFSQLAEVFCMGYNESTATSEMGIPLRLDPGVDKPSQRGSLKETYEQVLKDYKTAIRLLPKDELIIGRPNRAAAYAGAARAYLNMSAYEQAYAYADSSLQLRPDLLNFNDLKVTDELPIPKNSKEVLFVALSEPAGSMSFVNNVVVKSLYDSYGPNDTRLGIYFQARDAQQTAFRYKANYDQSKAQLFVGLTSSEMYLIKAEAAVRIGKTNEALTALNALLLKRYKSNAFTAVTEDDPAKLLSLILQEREKELLFRGRRWADLKRLNQDPKFQKTLTRSIRDKIYKLEPNSLRYAVRIPEPVVDIGKIPQNRR